MKAVNLIPRDARRGGPSGSRPQLGPAHAVVGLLAVALALVTVYVLSANTVAQRKATLTTLRTEVAQTDAQAASLTSYTRFEKLAQTRADTVRQIAATRFDWHAALSDLSKVVPANTSLQTLVATVAPGSGGSSGAGAGAGSSSLRGDITSPAFELTGCTQDQDDVARLMSRLRLINGVTRVTLGASQKPGGTTAGPSGAGSGCGQNSPTFDVLVFFAAPPGAATTGSTP
jgi:Tfp pilus assembly protein PilN